MIKKRASVNVLNTFMNIQIRNVGGGRDAYF